MTQAPRVVLLAGDGPSTRILYHALAADFHLERVILEEGVPRLEFLRRRVRKLGLLTVFGQLLFVSSTVPYLRREARRRIDQIKQEHGLRDEPIPPERIVRVASANSRACIDALRSLAPPLVVVNGTRILSDELLRSLEAPFLNVHAGITPAYRGVHGGYWALAQDDREGCGVTVHRLDTGIDTGPVIAQAAIRPTREDNFSSYPLLQLAAAIPLLKVAIQAGGKARAAAPPPSRARSRLWSHPTLWGYWALRLRKGVA